MANATQVWLLDADGIDPLAANNFLDQSELARAANFQNLQKRDQYVGARILSRVILSDQLGITPQDIEFSHENSRPVCVNEGAPIFSLSKRDNWIAMVVASSPVGIDLEKIDRVAADQFVMEELFSAAERAQLNDLSEAEMTQAYFGMWTQKEAYAKATGRGAELDFANIHTSPEGGLIEYLSDQFTETTFYGHALVGPKNYILTVVTSMEHPKIIHQQVKI